MADLRPPTPAEIEAICAAHVGNEWSAWPEGRRAEVRYGFEALFGYAPDYQQDLRIYRAGVAAGQSEGLALSKDEARLLLYSASTIRKAGGGQALLDRIRSFAGEDGQ